LLDEKKALDVDTIDLQNKTLMCDYFVLCSGTSNTHIRSVVDGLLKDGRNLGLKKDHIEGYQSAKWVLVDYGDIVVHVFDPAEREFYDLESLWKNTAMRREAEVS